MTNLRKSQANIIAILALFAVLLIGLCQATTTNLTVQAGEEISHSVNLAIEDRVLIQFTVFGETANTLHFSMIFPNATVRDFGEVGKLSHSFICDVEGEYSLHFTNHDQTEKKLVTLNYEVQHYIFGIPQMLFMTLIVVLACIGGVVAFIALGKTY